MMNFYFHTWYADKICSALQHPNSNSPKTFPVVTKMALAQANREDAYEFGIQRLDKEKVFSKIPVYLELGVQDPIIKNSQFWVRFKTRKKTTFYGFDNYFDLALLLTHDNRIAASSLMGKEYLGVDETYDIGLYNDLLFGKVNFVG